LLDVDDVDAIAFCENKTLHLWVPSTSLVSEVDSAVEELSHCYNCHDGILLLRFYLRMQLKPARFMAKQFVRPVALKITDHNFLWTEVVMPTEVSEC
jgi:hypothetical protein